MPHASITCPSCASGVEDGALFCPHCGDAIPYRTPEVDPFVGRTVSQRYQVIQRIARGGMGEVYLARHQELNQKAAVKFLHRRFAEDEEFATRFLNEARSAARVPHPNAVSIYDFGRLDEGTLYIVMEFCEGVSLKQMIKRDGRLPVKTALRIAIQTSEVLAAAHRQNIIHRDVKPDNLMVLEPPNGRVSVKVLDFGIAKMLDDEASQASLTQTGVTFGTPEYMSPEQASGREVDARSDVYSLGLVLFAMLTGEPPFSGKNKLALLQRHIREVPPRVDTCTPTAIPAALVDLIAESVEKDPKLRPPSMDAMLARLEEIDRTATDSAAAAAVPRAPGAAGAAPVASPRSRPDPSGRRVLTRSAPDFVDERPGSPRSRSGPMAVEEGYALSSDVSPTSGYELGTGSSRVADDGFSLGGVVRGPADDAYSLGDDNDDPRWVAPLPPRGGQPKKSRAPLYATVAIVVLALVVIANFAIRRATERGPEDVASEGSEPAPAGPTAAERAAAVLEVLGTGDLGAAERALEPLFAEAPDDAGVQEASRRLAGARGVVDALERALAANECDSGREQLTALVDHYGAAFDGRYRERVEACEPPRRPSRRATPRAEPAAAPAPARSAASAPAPAAEPAARAPSEPAATATPEPTPEPVAQPRSPTPTPTPPATRTPSAPSRPTGPVRPPAEL